MISLRKLWPLLVITASVELMMTSDRLITPLLLGLHDLAELAILLSLVGPPFRLLEMSVSYTLLPELASAPNRGGALRAIRHSGLIAAAISGAAAVAMLVVLEPLSHLLFGDKFHLTSGLVLAVVIAGLIRVAQSFANAAATALAPEEHLPRVAALGTLGAVLVVVGSIVGARWGLEGVIYGSILGWFFRTAVYAEIVREALRTKVQPASAVVSSPLYGVTKRVRLPQEAD
jgi:O-antigen/teichoic acid export membrane protein